jgi:hypothetical protein
MNDEQRGESVAEEEPNATLPVGLNYAMRGFSTEEDAHKLAHSIASALHYISRYIDLEQLDGLTVAYDYADALKELDRGVENLRPLTPSEGEVVGVAMAPAVLRDGKAKTHIVLAASYMEGLLEDEPADAFDLSLSVLAHECAHVEVHKYQEAAFPGSLLRYSFDDFETATMHHIAEICWEEYAACRLSAFFGKDSGASYGATITQNCAAARERTRKEIVAYRTHGDLNRLIGDAGSAIQTPLKYAAYLLGHMDAFDEGWHDYPDARAVLESSGYANYVDDLLTALRAMWENRGAWESWADFEPVRDVVRQLYQSAGLYFRGDRLNVRYRNVRSGRRPTIMGAKRTVWP